MGKLICSSSFLFCFVLLLLFFCSFFFSRVGLNKVFKFMAARATMYTYMHVMTCTMDIDMATRLFQFNALEWTD